MGWLQSVMSTSFRSATQRYQTATSARFLEVQQSSSRESVWSQFVFLAKKWFTLPNPESN
jgi:hypothetical protein